MQLKGVIFDLDGVITKTASVHFKAWQRMFNDFLESKGKAGDFTHDDDYIPYVDGKPRYKGVQSFLESRGIKLPFGDPSDEPGKETICGIGNQKNTAFREIVKNEGVDFYDSSLELVKKLKANNIKVGVASSSKNCRFILETVGLDDQFGTIVDGIVSQEEKLKGKPEPDIFIRAAENLGLKPHNCVVVEDAISGVQAGRNGNFGFVLGVTRTGSTFSLKANGADKVVHDLSEISLDDIQEWFKTGVYESNWKLSYHDFKPEEELLREVLTTTGNGFFGSRGTLESEKTDLDTFYPGTYIAGLYNKLPTEVHNKKIYNNDFVNCPNWLLIQLKIGDDKQPVKLLDCEILDYEHTLNMREAVVYRDFRIRDCKNRITHIQIQRYANMQNPHMGHIKYKLTPENYSRRIKLISGIDGSIINQGVPRYRQLASKHLETISQEVQNGILHHHTRTNSSKIDIHISVKNKLTQPQLPDMNIETDIDKKDEEIYEHISFNAQEQTTYILEKTAAIYTSSDMDVADPGQSSLVQTEKASTFDDLLRAHKEYWREIWNKTDIEIEGDRFMQRVTRLHIYHLMVTGSPHNENFDAGIPARGLHGEAYRGHIFWDEVFILPFYVKHHPNIVKAFLKYRYRRIDDARAYATQNGYTGVMFPWQTADDGKEETQEIHFNPVSEQWGPDLSRRQRHVSIAIAYNVLQYMKYTGDKNFFQEYGSDLYYGICRFWASIATYSEKDKKYHINGVMGPDEFHEKYPGKSDEEAGINDNAYTNIMVSWLLNKAVNMLSEVSDTLRKKINASKEEIKRWLDISENLFISISDDGIIEQFDGYFKLKELDWDHYKKKYGNIRRMDRILKAEGNSPDNYKVAKQADVIMAFYLLHPKQIGETLSRLGYARGDATELLRKNFDYYNKRTSHGSTLSYVVHAYVLKYLNVDNKTLLEWFTNAMKSDIFDTQGGTTREGIHTGVMAASLDIIIKNFAGLNMNDAVEITPNMPDHWSELSFKVKYRAETFKYTITHDQVKVEIQGDSESDTVFVINGKKQSILNRKTIIANY